MIRFMLSTNDQIRLARIYLDQYERGDVTWTKMVLNVISVLMSGYIRGE